jgi:uncharacterized protein YoxC
MAEGRQMTTDERLDRIEKSIENLTRNVQEFRTETVSHLEIVDTRLDRVEKSIENITRYVQDFRTETVNHLEIFDTRLSVLAASFASLDLRMAPLTKAVVDFGEIVNRMQLEQSRIARLVEPAA